MAKPPKLSQTWDAYGIANHYGEPWTPRTFDTREAAQDHLDKSPFKTPRHKVVPVRVTVRIEKVETTLPSPSLPEQINDGVA